MFDLDDVRAFAKIVEAGSLSRASAQLGMSKSMLSRRLARLEARLGGPLMARTTKGISVTSAGQDFKIHADRILAEIQAGMDAVSGQGEASGRLRVAAPLSFGVRHLAPLLAELALAHPRLAIETSYSDRLVDLVGEGFDVAIRIGDLPDSSLIARRIGPVRAVLVASAAYLARAGTPETPSELPRHDMVFLGHETWRFQDGSREIRIRPQGRFIADNGEALLAAAVAGLGVALLPAFLAAPSLQTGELRRILPDHPPPETSLHVLRPPPGGHPPIKVRVLSEMLLARFGNGHSWEDSLAADARSLPHLTRIHRP